MAVVHSLCVFLMVGLGLAVVLLKRLFSRESSVP